MAGIEMGILYWIQGIRNPLLDQIMLIITRLGDGGILWMIFAFLFCIKKETRKTGILILVAIGLEVLLCNGILKPMIQRIRPNELDHAISLLIDRPNDYSFPSGHTGAAFAFCASLILVRNRYRYIAVFVSVLIAFSRMYLFVHYPTDILGGILLGIFSSYIAYQILQRFNENSHKTFLSDSIIKTK